MSVRGVWRWSCDVLCGWWLLEARHEELHVSQFVGCKLLRSLQRLGHRAASALALASLLGCVCALS
eukprot:4842522-Alexandrium_andersonii.AAC.1